LPAISPAQSWPQRWEPFNTLLASNATAGISSDVRAIIPLKNDPAQYIDSGVMKVRVRFLGGASSSWTAYIDQLRWDVIGT
jgi:hypothetical protein